VFDGLKLRMSRHSLLRTAGVILGVALGFACQHDPYTASAARQKPDVAALTGHWRASAETLRALTAGGVGVLSPTIDLRADGQITMQDAPSGWRSGSRIGTVGESFVGTWALQQQRGGWWELTLREGSWGCSGCLMVLNDRAPHVLVLRYDDPDAGHGYEFERAVEQMDAADERR
jgi:hypothetical protein